MPVFAAVDIGSNSVRLKIARSTRGRLTPLHEDREVTRLGESVFRTGSLDPAAIENTVKVLRRFHRATQEYAVERIRVVATSALRDARNARAFLDWVRTATGWKVEVISGLEEGRLIHLGVMSNIRVGRARVLLIDLGGGSCELTISRQGRIERTTSLPLGAVRLTRDFLQHDPPKKRELSQLRAFITEELRRVRSDLAKYRYGTVIATSGTPAALVDMWSAETGEVSTRVPRPALMQMTKQLSRMPEEERRQVKGIGPRRAEIIVAGAWVFAELLKQLQLAAFTYQPYGLRDGILAQMAAEDSRGTGLSKQIASEREESVVTIARQYKVDLKYAARVRKHAEALFRLLKRAHELPPEYGTWITAAAMLHGVGSFVNRSGRYRHAYYLIANSELFGFSVQEREIVAAIARYMGTSFPDAESGPVRRLPQADRVAVPKAVAIVRLARALEQSRTGAVKRTSATVGAKKVKLKLRASANAAALELWALERERAYFLEVFGRKLDFELE